ncbi:MAG: CcoQ/FixQ family Cbb3-type cytochrome c oxidase assembly chaperone [Deltaproteobacteria bacterium]|nr:CcoQ/FixQ family Cbb3-type cytochrome c oxidase assembly chaperone [Deltaproteobacteria bacterium]
MTWLPCVGMLIFLFLFLAALFWVYRKDTKDFYQKLAKLPLE